MLWNSWETAWWVSSYEYRNRIFSSRNMISFEFSYTQLDLKLPCEMFELILVICYDVLVHIFRIAAISWANSINSSVTALKNLQLLPILFVNMPFFSGWGVWKLLGNSRKNTLLKIILNDCLPFLIIELIEINKGL